VLNSLLGKPTLTKILISSIWVQVAIVNALAIIDAPYHSPLREFTEPETLQVHVQFAGAEQVQSLDALPVEMALTEFSELEDDLENALEPEPEVEPRIELEVEVGEPQGELPAFEPVLVEDSRPNVESDSTELLAKADVNKEATANQPLEPSTPIELVIAEKALPPPLQPGKPAVGTQPQQSRRDGPKSVPRQSPKRFVEFQPSVPAVSSPQLAGTHDQQPPTFSSNRPPSYPTEAYQAGIEGEVLLKLHVSSTGEVERVDISRSSGYRILDEAARDAVKNWRGTPALRNGRAVAAVEHLPVRFRLRRN